MVVTTMNAKRERRPEFFWQGVLIVLPVVLLTGIGLFALRQDRILAQHEATDRAQAIADELAQKLWTELTTIRPEDRTNYPSFQVNRSGELLFPPPYDSVPTPQPLDAAELSREQAGLWLTLQRASSSPTDRADAISAGRQFLQLRPPDRFAGAAHYQVGLLLLETGDAKAAGESFALVRTKFPDVVGESGLPLQPLAELKLVEAEVLQSGRGRVANIYQACSNAIFQPSPVTPYVLQRATELLGPNPDPALEPLLEEWDRQNQTRGLFAAARPRLLASETLRAPFVAPSATPGSLLLAAPAKVPSIQMPRLFWFTNREDSFWSASHQGMHKHSLVGRAMNRDLISQVTVPLEAGLSLDSNRDNGKEIPSPVQTRRIAREPFRDQDWLAIRTSEEKDGAWFVCRPRLNPEPFLDRLSDKDTSMTLVAWRASWNGPPRLSKEVLDPVMLEMAKFLQRVPEYFGVTLDVAGKTIVSSNQLPAISYVGGGKSGGHYSKQGVGGNPPELLAVAAKVEDGVPQLRVGVHLIGHDLLFSRQRSRTAWFGLLIAASAVAAIIGFVSARRAFQKQQRLAEMKSNFVSSVSHELRAPIASVRLMAEGLERGQVQDTAKQGEYFRFIVQECRRLSSLIENVLDFSRIEQGRKQYELEPTDLVALVRQTVKGMEPYAAERQIQLAVESLNLQSAISNLQPSVDGRAIQQALVNLIDNAIKHSPGGSTVTIGLESVGKAEGRRQKAESEVSPPAPAPAIQLWVEDTGEGIPPEEHERIFERFYRCGSELRRETQGVGIGLSIVKHIVEAHGGRVLVRSAVGEGSRFTIELPLKEVIE